MIISGVHLDPSGKPVRYKVENSWGDRGNKGYFVMTDAWFEQYVFPKLFSHLLPTHISDRFGYQIVVPKALAPRDLVEVYESDECIILPPWDPVVWLCLGSDCPASYVSTGRIISWGRGKCYTYTARCHVM